MKKIVIYILALITLFIAGIALSTAYAETNSNPANIEELIAQAKKAKKEAVAQDLYLDIYQKVGVEPAEKAAKEAGKTLKLSGDDVNKVISEGDLAPILSKNKDEEIQNLTTKYQVMYQEYYSKLDTENLRSDLVNKVTPTEIFKDGDTSNSDFDILYDLTVIEVILFNEGSISSFGGKFQTPDFDFTDPEETALLDELFERDQTTTSSSTTPTTQTTEIQDEFSALSCLADENNLENALNAFEENQQNTAGSGPDNQLDEDVILDDSGFPLAEPDDWPAKYLCPDGAFFCIEVKFDFGASKVYSKTDNCVFCHIQNINKELDKMLGKPLTANKVSGNLFEMPKCKSSFTNIGVNMNVITMAVPPPKQANTDMYVKLNIEKQWQTLLEKYNPFYFNTGTNAGLEQNVEDRATNKAISNASPDGSLQEVVNKATQIIQGKTAESVQSQLTGTKTLQTELQNKQYQTLIEELDAWKIYFKSIKELMDKMVEACNNFANTPNCT
jgi:hypothetical protein